MPTASSCTLPLMSGRVRCCDGDDDGCGDATRFTFGEAGGTGGGDACSFLAKLSMTRDNRTWREHNEPAEGLPKPPGASAPKVAAPPIAPCRANTLDLPPPLGPLERSSLHQRAPSPPGAGGRLDYFGRWSAGASLGGSSPRCVCSTGPRRPPPEGVQPHPACGRLPPAGSSPAGYLLTPHTYRSWARGVPRRRNRRARDHPPSVTNSR
jgi:hypothetical protein